MARSTYIYVMVAMTGQPLAAFTVKRELIEVGRRLQGFDRTPDRIKVLRFEDGRRGAGKHPYEMGTLREVIDDHA